jgi:hypothetical protein
MNEEEFDKEFIVIPEKTINDIKREIEEMTDAIVLKAKAEVKSKYGNRKRHRQ